MDGINLPEHWKILPFIDCLKKVKSKKKPSIPKKDYQESGEFPVIDQGASFIAGWTDSFESVISDNLPAVIFGDHTRIFKYVDFPFVLGADGTQLLYPNDEILDARFFYYALSNLNVPNKGYNRHYRYLQEFSVVCPSLPEQRAIAHILHTIQEAKFTRQREIALERERKAALMDFLFSHGTKGEPHKQTEIGEIPENWKVVKLEKLCECLDSKRVPIKQSDRNERKGEVPYYGASGQIDWIDDYLFDEPLLLIAEDGENLVSRKLPIAYSIEGKSWVNNHAHVLRVNDIKQFFLEYYFNSIDLAPYLSGATRPKLNKASLLNIPVPRPSKEETDKIALVLVSCDEKIAALEREVELIDELFHAMLDELMTGQRSAVPLIDVGLLNSQGGSYKNDKISHEE